MIGEGKVVIRDGHSVAESRLARIAGYTVDCRAHRAGQRAGRGENSHTTLVHPPAGRTEHHSGHTGVGIGGRRPAPAGSRQPHHQGDPGYRRQRTRAGDRPADRDGARWRAPVRSERGRGCVYPVLLPRLFEDRAAVDACRPADQIVIRPDRRIDSGSPTVLDNRDVSANISIETCRSAGPAGARGHGHGATASGGPHIDDDRWPSGGRQV